MKRFIYFLPGVTGCPSVQKLRECGLGHAFPNAGASGETLAGPGNQAGMLVAMGDGAALNYDPAKQRWIQLSDKAWVGLSRDPAEQPGPEDLQSRAQLIDGYPVRLADGNDWHIPIVRFLNGETALPRVIVVDDKGNPTTEVQREFKPLVNLARQFKTDIFAKRGQYDTAALLLLGGLALGVNYRLGAVEVGMLGLLTTENVREIGNSILDGPNLARLFEEYEKKKALAESSNGAASIPG